MWTAARARLRAVGPGFSVVAPVEADGSARIEFLPTAPGPVSLWLVMPGSALGRAVGAPVDTLAGLRAAGAPAELVQRVLAAPATWAIDDALIPAGVAPGDAPPGDRPPGLVSAAPDAPPGSSCFSGRSRTSLIETRSGAVTA